MKASPNVRGAAHALCRWLPKFRFKPSRHCYRPAHQHRSTRGKMHSVWEWLVYFWACMLSRIMIGHGWGLRAEKRRRAAEEQSKRERIGGDGGVGGEPGVRHGW